MSGPSNLASLYLLTRSVALKSRNRLAGHFDSLCLYSNLLPQCLQTFASILITSAQSGHFFVTPSLSLGGSNITNIPTGPSRMPIRNQPQPLRPLERAMLADMRPNVSQKRNPHSINILYFLREIVSIKESKLRQLPRN